MATLQTYWFWAFAGVVFAGLGALLLHLTPQTFFDAHPRFHKIIAGMTAIGGIILVIVVYKYLTPYAFDYND